jgi:glutathione S-transferase
MKAADGFQLYGYQYSVYQRIVRLTLEEKGIAYETIEVDPFLIPEPDLLRLHPFRKVPILVHGAFRIFETAAICTYLDEVGPGAPLQPPAPQARARMNQIRGILDSYGYWPLVRDVYAQRVFAPAFGREPDEARIAAGLSSARTVLDALEFLVCGTGFLVSTDLSLADLHLAPMLAAFDQAPEGRLLLGAYPRLAQWLDMISIRPSLKSTHIALPTPADRMSGK